MARCKSIFDHREWLENKAPAANIKGQRSRNTKKAAATTTTDQKKLTDYFSPVRRSQRQLGQALAEKEQKLLYQALIDGVDDGVKVTIFPEKGRGIVAARKFNRREFIVEYAGDLITLSQAKENEAKYAEDDNIGCYMYYFQFKNRQYCIDATAESGRLGRLANHSRSGNCLSKVVEVHGQPRLILIAKKDIEAGEEILYDYGDRRRTAVKDHPWLNH